MVLGKFVTTDEDGLLVVISLWVTGGEAFRNNCMQVQFLHMYKVMLMDMIYPEVSRPSPHGSWMRIN